VLLQGGADANLSDNMGYTPLVTAVHKDNLDIVKLLLDHGGSPNLVLGNLSPIHQASLDDHATLVALLLNRGADANLENGALRTPLHLAAFNGSADAVPLLLKRGADPCARSLLGRTPVDSAEAQSHLGIAGTLRAAAAGRCR